MSTPLRRVLGLGVALLLGACEAREPARLLDHDGWSLVPLSQDPWAADAPANASCHEGSGRPEEGYYEVSTEICSWGTWSQPVHVDGKEGDRWEVELFHQALWSPVPATAVVELAIGSEVVVAWSSSIPAEAARFDLQGLAPAFDGEARAYLHVHNHGVNSYRIGDVTAYPRE